MNTNTIGKIVSFILIVAVLAGAVGIIYSLTNGFTSEISTFSITIGDKTITETTKGFNLDRTKPTEVKVNNMLDSTSEGFEGSGYEVKVIPNPEKSRDFDFTVDGDMYSYRAISDLSAGFEINKQAESFTIKPKGGIDKILSCCYGDKQITDAMENTYKDMYVLVVTSANGEHSISVYFSITEYASDIYLDKEEVTF